MTTETQAKKARINVSTLSYWYLHADGHAILVHEKYDPKAGRIRWVEIIKNLGPKCSFKGRLVFHRNWRNDGGLFNLIRKAYQVIMHEQNGSEKSRLAGIRVQTLEINAKEFSFTVDSLPDLLGGEYSYQPENTDTFEMLADKYSWAGHNITARHES